MNRAQRRQQEKAARSGRSSLSTATLGQALEHLQRGKLKRAEGLLARILKVNSTHPDALHYQGVVMYQQGRYQESIKHLSAALSAAPDYAEAHNSLCIVLMEQRNYDEAISHAEQALKIRPDFSGAHANLGNAYQEQGELGRAAASYRTALAFDPTHREAAYRMASAYLALNDPEQALVACATCLDIDPHCQHALAYKAISLQLSGRCDEARGLYEFERMIHRTGIETPRRYENLSQYNQALGKAVKEHPSLVWEPFNRVTRGGAVTGDLLLQPTKIVKSLEHALRGAIDSYRNSLSAEPGHPLLGRIPNKYRLTLIASILRAGGHHPPHIHESAWLSGVYYACVPDTVKCEDRAHAGWLEFGQPDCPLAEDVKLELTAQQPHAGLALLFPSYFFHGTIPFEGGEERIGIAFDVYPEG